MEVALSAILGEIVHRSLSFLIDKFSKETAASPSSGEDLRRKLLRVRIIVEEAEGRQMRNHAMLEQLKVLREGLYRGYYVLDTFRLQELDNGEDGHGAVSVSPSFALSKFNPAKRVQLCGGRRRRRRRSSSEREEELHQVIGSLEKIITDASEFAMFINVCPPLYRQIYSTYMIMEKCMFGRHVEMECIINFLMENQGSSSGPGNHLDVLPVVGPMKAGKSTLIEHACNDARVRELFSQIVFFTKDQLDGRRRITPVRDDGTVKYQNHALDMERVLLLVEVTGDIDEAQWSSLYSAFRKNAANGSKVIICSRCNEVARFGTTRALKVEYLTQEAYWYFFKALAFGTIKPEEEPELASMAMEIAMCISGSFIIGNIMASILRTNSNAKFWCMALSWIKEIRQRYGFIYGGHPVSPWHNTKPSHVPTINNPSKYVLTYNDYEVVSANDEVQENTMIHDILLRGVVPCGRYDVLGWRSSIPPYNNCMFSIEIRKAPRMDVQRKNVHSTNR